MKKRLLQGDRLLAAMAAGCALHAHFESGIGGRGNVLEVRHPDGRTRRVSQQVIDKLVREELIARAADAPKRVALTPGGFGRATTVTGFDLEEIFAEQPRAKLTHPQADILHVLGAGATLCVGYWGKNFWLSRPGDEREYVYAVSGHCFVRDGLVDGRGYITAAGIALLRQLDPAATIVEPPVFEPVVYEPGEVPF
jgi:hypothetical protein